MMRNDGDTRPTKFYRITKIVEVYILASDETDALEMAEKGYGIQSPFRNPRVQEIEDRQWYAGIEGVEDENGGWFNGDGTAMFYNDEYHELYRLDPETRVWRPVDEPEDWDDLDDRHHESDIDTGFNRAGEDGDMTWMDFMETNGR